jgi:chemotaxis protein MotA
MDIVRRADGATIAGLMIATAGLLLGLHFEGIQLIDVGQLTAALIVVCGTIGAVLISMPMDQTVAALKMIPAMLQSTRERDSDVIERMIRYSRLARQRGLLSLEQESEEADDPFVRRAMRLAVDAVGPEMMKEVLDGEIAGVRAQAESAAAFYETAAGYAPTLGVAGAAIGLVQVMKHLDHLEQVGMGVASAFVATIYGVLLANLVLLPVATKIRARSDARARVCALTREGAIAISSGMNPSLIRMKLEALAQIPEDKPERPAKVRNAA